MVVGNGSMADKIREMADNNITIKSKVPKDELAKLFANCKALIFPQLEDYGITPLEANAAGRPVIAYGKGGVLETIEPYTNDASKASALFFDEQNEQSLKKSLKQFETLQFDPEYIRAHARKFDEQVFIDKIVGLIHSKFQEHNPEA
jgi:glycosyltransferase involved in cell wall biosynthesis